MLNKLRLLTKYRREPFSSFRKMLGFTPNNIDYYLLAVRHRSMSIRERDGRNVNNERLEFLGDAMLNAVVAELIYQHYPDAKEGFLTNARSNIVKRDSLNKLCLKIGLDKLIVANKQVVGRERTHIRGNALEALIGAIYLDAGYRRCVRFVAERLIEPAWLRVLAEDDDNYKSRLIEWCQRRRQSLVFELIEDKVDDRNFHTFVSQVVIDGKPTSTGMGRSKKESHQRAAKNALKILRTRDKQQSGLRED